MKCENCGKNEVTFVYRSNVNGHVEEKHLCSDCAEKLGYTQRLGAQQPADDAELLRGQPLWKRFLRRFLLSHAQPAGAEKPDAGGPL